MEIKAGYAVDVAFNADRLGPSRSVKAMVYEIVGRQIIISQTSPPLSAADIGQELELSFVRKAGARVRRFGFNVRVAGFVGDYEIASESRVTAVILERREDPREINVRNCFRVKPVAGVDLVLQLGKERLSIIDISIGGVQFSHSRWGQALKPYQTVQLTLGFDGRNFDVDGQVMRVWTMKGADQRRDIEFVSVSFPKLEGEVEYRLSKRLFMLERECLAQGKL